MTPAAPFIDGKAVAGDGAERVALINPATEEPFGEVASALARDIASTHHTLTLNETANRVPPSMAYFITAQTPEQGSWGERNTVAVHRIHGQD